MIDPGEQSLTEAMAGALQRITGVSIDRSGGEGKGHLQEHDEREIQEFVIHPWSMPQYPGGRPAGTGASGLPVKRRMEPAPVEATMAPDPANDKSTAMVADED